MTALMERPRRQRVACLAQATWRDVTALCLDRPAHDGLHWDHRLEVAWSGRATLAVPAEALASPAAALRRPESPRMTAPTCHDA